MLMNIIAWGPQVSYQDARRVRLVDGLKQIFCEYHPLYGTIGLITILLQLRYAIKNSTSFLKYKNEFYHIFKISTVNISKIFSTWLISFRLSLKKKRRKFIRRNLLGLQLEDFACSIHSLALSRALALAVARALSGAKAHG